MTETHSNIAPPEKPEVLLMKIELYALPPQIAAPESEEEMFINNGFIPISLGSRVLRTETASLCALSMINYEWW